MTAPRPSASPCTAREPPVSRDTDLIPTEIGEQTAKRTVQLGVSRHRARDRRDTCPGVLQPMGVGLTVVVRDRFVKDLPAIVVLPDPGGEEVCRSASRQPGIAIEGGAVLTQPGLQDIDDLGDAHRHHEQNRPDVAIEARRVQLESAAGGTTHRAIRLVAQHRVSDELRCALRTGTRKRTRLSRRGIRRREAHIACTRMNCHPPLRSHGTPREGSRKTRPFRTRADRQSPGSSAKCTIPPQLDARGELDAF